MTDSKVEIKKKKKKKRRRRHRRQIYIFLLLLIIFISTLLWKRNELTKYFLENFLTKIVNADISLSAIEINNKGIYFDDLKVESKSDVYYYLDTSHLAIDINYTSLFNTNIWLKEAIDSVYIESPTLSYRQSFGKENKSKKTNHNIEIKSDNQSPFNINNYLRKANITDAQLTAEVVYGEYFGIRDSFSDADLSFDNKRDKTLIANMHDNKNNPFQVELKLDENGLNSIALNVNGYNPDSLYVPVARDLDVKLKGDAILQFVTNDGLYLGLNLESEYAKANIYDMALELDNLRIMGDSNNLSVLPKTSTFEGIPISVQGELINLFDELEIEAKAHIFRYQIGKTFTFMQGIVNAEVAVSGFADNLHITGQVNSDSLDFNSMAVTNINATLDYQEQFEINLLNAELDRNTLSGKGILHKNFISADLLIKNKEDSAITLQGNLLTKGIIIDGESYFRLKVSDFTIGYNQMLLPPISGLVYLDKDILRGDLSNQSISLELNTDLAFTKSAATIKLLDFHAHDAYTILQDDTFYKMNPLVNGTIEVSKENENLTADIDLEITAFQDQIYLPLKSEVKWDLSSNKMEISNSMFQGKVFNSKTNMSGEVTLTEFNKLNIDMEINKGIVIKAKNVLSDDRQVRFEINQLSLTEIKDFLPKKYTENYPDGFITLNVDYNWSSAFITGEVYVTGIKISGFSGYGLEGHFEGVPERICLTKLLLFNERQILLSASGSVETTNGIVANVGAVLNEVDFSDYQHLIPLKGFVKADLSFRYDSKDEEKYSIRFKGVGSDFKIADYDINDIYFNVLYTPQKFHVDNLYLNSVNYADMNVIGDFSYDLFKNEFIPSDERLYVKLDADAYKFLQKLSPDLFEEGKFNLRSELIMGIDEDGFQVYDGYLISEDSYLQMTDQPERINNINFTAIMKDNKLDLEKCELNLGDGYLRITNSISEDIDNFFVGNLILGQLRVFTSQKGILAHIPEYMPKDETALINITGQYNNYASIKGPFDDMKIDAEVTVSNASIIYPPDTENLLSIITSASKNTFSKKEKKEKKEKETNNALPFELDVKLIVGENTKYATYPTDITVTPNSYLVLTYNNNEWSVPDAKFVAEEGTVTFLDTDFDVDLVEIMINEIDFSINGSFVKRVQDGSTVTLRVSNEQSNQVGLNDLVLTLASDNPNDKTQSQAINRLRVSDSNYDIEQENQNVLQDETMLMLGSNVDNTFFNSFLRPVETFFRKRLELDYFYIKSGFVKNMLNNYVINRQDSQITGNQTQNVSDSELAQFSSTILLNNLTINLGRPVYKRLYFNYEGFFQETTNLNRESKIIYDQDFQLRTNIDFRTKMTYTFKYRPSGTNSHEIMLFHSINF